jgi:hypothetical protein
MPSPLINSARRLAAVTALLAVTLGAAAQADKSVATESVPAFPAFSQWLGAVVVAMPDSPVTLVTPIPLTIATAPVESVYQPLPVIVGVPELPLIGSGAAQSASKVWNQGWNFQGVHMRLVVLDSRGARRELRSLAAPLRAGERFKIRLTPTFNAVADVDQVIGDPWYGKRTGQVYPQAGSSVQLNAGETVDLPVGDNEYFVMHRSANQRLVVSVRHPKALGDLRSNQPAYRQDGKSGSSFLQLVGRGSHPAIEQLIALAQ